MNVAEFSIRRKTIVLVATALTVVGGIYSYGRLGRLEDPEFTIKDALVMTPYGGATAAEVEEEVTNVIEKAAQQLGQVKRVTSKSDRGLSTVTVKIKDKYGKDALPQVWDELRRKVNDAQGELPPGAGPSIVNDDFGDVYGIFVAVTGDGYTPAEIKNTSTSCGENCCWSKTLSESRSTGPNGKPFTSKSRARGSPSWVSRWKRSSAACKRRTWSATPAESGSAAATSPSSPLAVLPRSNR